MRSTDSQVHEIITSKVHLRGLDNLKTSDIKAFASTYFAYEVERVEWIDDTSANLVYKDATTAAEALRAFSAEDLVDLSQLLPEQSIPTKSLPSQPEIVLSARFAHAGDRKQAGAREKSRFYLMNPEFDRDDRRPRSRPTNKYRNRDDGYSNRGYTERENRRRMEENVDFDASLYDDDEASRASRASRQRQGDKESSPGSLGSRITRRGSRSHDLFSTNGRYRDDGRLRDRSASPTREVEDSARSAARKDDAAATNRAKAQMIKAAMRSDAGRELFPSKMTQRSGAFDHAEDAADLFAHKMPRVPFMDGSADTTAPDPRSLAARITKDGTGAKASQSADAGLRIRGAADVLVKQKFAIKGAASVKELFPAHSADNSTKELFSNRSSGRLGKRNKAEDLFS